MRDPATRVAIQGEAGAFSHEAARRVYGPDAQVVPCETFDALFDAVSTGAADAGMVPVENTLAGAVQRPMDLLLTPGLTAAAETRVAVRLHLAARPGASLDTLRSAASHPVALQQCLGFFRQHPHIERRTSYDTAGSIRSAVQGDGSEAGIGSELAAELYGAVILARDVQDHAENHTRFLAVEARDGAGTGVALPAGVHPKTSIAFTVPHTPGALHRALGCFADAGVDLSRVESRPIPGQPWEYRFYADLRGAAPEAQDAAVERLRALGGRVVVIGRYREEAPEA